MGVGGHGLLFYLGGGSGSGFCLSYLFFKFLLKLVFLDDYLLRVKQMDKHIRAKANIYIGRKIVSLKPPNSQD